MYISTTHTCACADRGSLNAAAAMPYPRSDRQNPVLSSYASLSTAAAAAGSLPWESVRAQWRAIARVTECEADRGRVDWKAWAAWRDLGRSSCARAQLRGQCCLRKHITIAPRVTPAHHRASYAFILSCLAMGRVGYFLKP